LRIEPFLELGGNAFGIHAIEEIAAIQRERVGKLPVPHPLLERDRDAPDKSVFQTNFVLAARDEASSARDSRIP
jgi:hypothetical protein